MIRYANAAGFVRYILKVFAEYFVSNQSGNQTQVERGASTCTSGRNLSRWPPINLLIRMERPAHAPSNSAL